MTDTREKLIELLETVVSPNELLCYGEVLVSTSRVADHLIANGVTVQEWIPVTERLPEKFGEYIVAVKDMHGKTYSDYADYDIFQNRWTTGLYRTAKEKVTHWMPLPEPPKGE